MARFLPRLGRTVFARLQKLPSILPLVATTHVFAANIAIPDGIAHPGETISASVSFSGEGRVLSGLQFDIECDPALSIRVAPGPTIARSSKLLFQRTLGPETVRILIVGLNRTPVSDGELLQLFITVAPNAPPFVSLVTLANPVGVSPESAPVSLSAEPMRLTIQNGAVSQIIPLSGVVNAASLLPGPVSPGEIVTLFRSVRSPNPVVLFNGQPSPVLFAGENQINTVVPFNLDSDREALLEVVQGASRGSVTVAVAPASPAIFTFGSGGTGQGAILNQDNSLNSESSPAPRGSFVMIFGTGFGRQNRAPAGPTGTFATTVSPVTATIDGALAEVTYAGEAPGLVSGLTQINLRVPDSVGPNSQAAILLKLGSRSSQPGVTISIR